MILEQGGTGGQARESLGRFKSEKPLTSGFPHDRQFRKVALVVLLATGN
jgi:hypothetical protein